MWHTLWLVIIAVSQCDVATTENVKCELSKRSTTYHYVCQIGPNQRIEVSVNPSFIIEVTCHNIDTINPTDLPEFDFGKELGQLHVKNCPIMRNGFQEILKRFHITELYTFKFFGDSFSGLFQTHHFDGFVSIEGLTLRNDIEDLDGNIFRATPQLTQLNLSKNKLQLYDEFFKYTPQLVKLNLDNNNITYLSHNIFKGLINLRFLYLRSNNIKSIETYAFRELVALQDLRLRNNLLTEIDENAFEYQGKLRIIDISNNKLVYISEKMFHNCTNLEKIFSEKNEKLVLEDGVFSQFSYLNLVMLNNNDISMLPANIFMGSRNLFEIHLQYNRLKYLPREIFKNLELLETLHLNNNFLETLEKNIFTSLQSLKFLNLRQNLLIAVNESLLEGLENLKKLDLSFNKIKSIHSDMFAEKNNLMYLLINNNELDFHEFPINTMDGCKNVKMINFANNRISKFPYSMLESLMKASKVDMDTPFQPHAKDPKVVNVIIQRNNISEVRFSRFTPDNISSSFQVWIQVDISRNPINCDCIALDLVPRKSLKNVEKRGPRNRIIIQYDDIFCAGPPALVNTSIKNVDLHDFVCPMENKCTLKNECNCFYRSVTETVTIDCSKQNITEIPQLILGELPEYFHFIKLNRVEVHLEDNFLKAGPTKVNGYDNVNELYLERNIISSIEWLPKYVEVLNLEHNRLESIDPEILKSLNESITRKLRLSDNPWRCDCAMRDFITYLWTHYSEIGNATSVRCQAVGTPLVLLDEEEICPLRTVLVSVLSSVILSCFIIISVIILMYYVYQQEILIWLYARGSCLCLIKEERVDKNKKYDAFISFAHQDEEFVMDRLLPILELGSPQYKFCVHIRDWIPGQYIATQISNSVKDSRRTLIILSPNFIQSVWGRMEFRTAHTSAMKEGRVRIILIIYGDVEIDQLDEELKAYITTNTYIKWGDPWFWEKLRYALPRTRQKQNEPNLRRTSIQRNIELQ